MTALNAFSGCALACVLGLAPAVANAAVVANTAGLIGALKTAKPDETILLAPGGYANVILMNVKGPVTIASADPAHPAVFKDLLVIHATRLTLRDLDLSAADAPVGPYGPKETVQFVIRQADGLTLERIHVHGSPTGSLATDVSGLIVRDSANVVLADSDFEYLHNGFEHLNVKSLTVRRNHFHHLRDDGMRGGGSSNVLVEDNECDSNHPDPEDNDHPDCFQFWTANTTQSAHDITIRNNHYHRGSGRPVQGIFIKDDYKKFPFLNLTISGNVIEGAIWHGISIDNGSGAVIEDNRVCGYPDQLSWIMTRDSKGSIVRRNEAQKFVDMNSTGTVSTQNKIIPACSPR